MATRGSLQRSKEAKRSMPEPSEHQSAEIKRVCFDAGSEPSDTHENRNFFTLKESLFNSNRVKFCTL